MRRLSFVVACSLLPSVALAQDYSVTTVGDATAEEPSVAATALEIEPAESPGADLAETLAEVPGVHPRRTSFGQTAYATIRGGNTRQLWVEWEGLRLSPPFGPGYDLSSSSLLGFDQVIVWRGPAATFRGSGALTGALEFRTRHAPEAGAGVRASAVAGSHDSSDLRVEGGAAGDELSVRVGAARRASEGDFEFVDEQGVQHSRINNDHERVGVFASLRKRAGDTSALASFAYDGGERGTPGLSEFQEQFRFARLTDRHVLGLVRVDHRNIADELDGHVVVGHQRRRLIYENPVPFLAGEPIEETTDASTSEVSLGSSLFRDSVTAMMELSSRRETWTTDDVSAARLLGGFGGSLEKRFADDTFGIWGAARAEMVRHWGAVVTPSLGAWWMPEAWTLRVNAGRTFRSPDLDELYLETEGVRGNADLVPESAWSADVGVDYRLDGTTLSATYFERIAEDEILFLPVSAYLVEARNIEGTHARGAEAAVAGHYGRLFGKVSYALVDARFRETGAPAPLQPPHRAFARLETELGGVGLPLLARTRKLRLVGEVEARSRIFLDAFGNRTDGPTGFVDFGLVGGQRVIGWSAFVRNVFDVQTAVDALQQPLPGRTVWFALRVGELP